MNDMISIFGMLIRIVTDVNTFKDYTKVESEDMPCKYERTHMVSDCIKDRLLEKNGSFIYFKDGVVIYLAPEY